MRDEIEYLGPFETIALLAVPAIVTAAWIVFGLWIVGVIEYADLAEVVSRGMELLG